MCTESAKTTTLHGRRPSRGCMYDFTMSNHDHYGRFSFEDLCAIAQTKRALVGRLWASRSRPSMWRFTNPYTSEVRGARARMGVGRRAWARRAGAGQPVEHGSLAVEVVAVRIVMIRCARVSVRAC